MSAALHRSEFPPSRLGRLAFALSRRLRAICRVAAERRALARMDDRGFADMGISRAQALHEMNRRPWDTAPATSR
jgi:uncharacterized protein YjiS (DUF1127 family)